MAELTRARLVPAFVCAALVALSLVARLGPGSLAAGVAVLAVLLAPGFAAWRALAPGRPWEPAVDLAATVVLGLAVIALALALTFVARRSLDLTLALLGAFTVVLAAIAARTPAPPVPRSELRLPGLVAAGGLALGAAGSRLVRIDVDLPFHLARVRKLASLGRLSVDSMAELVHGSTHPGYAFPLWHVVSALSSRVAGVDPTVAFRGVVIGLVPLAALFAYALVRAVVGLTHVAAAAATAALVVGVVGRGAGGWVLLASPAVAAPYLIVPALGILALAFWSRPAPATAIPLGAAALALAVIHPTYVVLAGLALGAGALAAAGRRLPWRRTGASAGLVVVPLALYTLWVLPLARDLARRVGSGAVEGADLDRYAGLGRILRFHGLLLLDPRHLLLTGTLALLGLAVLPAAAWLGGSRGRAVLGAAAALLLVALVPPLFTALTRLITVSQGQRIGVLLAPALPLAAGAAGLTGRLAGRPRVLCAGALGVGVAAALADRVPALQTPLATAAAVAIVGAAVIALRGVGARPVRDSLAALVLLALVAPIAIVNAPAFARRVLHPPRQAWSLSPTAVQALRALPHGTVVLADLPSSYLIPAYTDDLVFSAPLGNVANTRENDPARRIEVTRAILRPTLPEPQRRRLVLAAGVQYLLVDRRRSGYLNRVLHATPGYVEVARDRTYQPAGTGTYVLYRVAYRA